MTREEFEKAREERQKAVHFRTIGVPCCGNCKWFKYGDMTKLCTHPDSMMEEPCWVGIFLMHSLLFTYEHNVCDCFAPREDGTENV